MKRLALLVALMSTGCTNEGGAMAALRSAGYKKVEMTGFRFFGCGEGDSFHNGFSAVGQDGRAVVGVVCCGWFKGCTIRLDE